jgi:hypothetical protein
VGLGGFLVATVGALALDYVVGVVRQWCVLSTRGGVPLPIAIVPSQTRLPRLADVGGLLIIQAKKPFTVYYPYIFHIQEKVYIHSDDR